MKKSLRVMLIQYQDVSKYILYLYFSFHIDGAMEAIDNKLNFHNTWNQTQAFHL